MLIDTVHKSQSAVVMITITAPEERGRSDDAWRWVARNQHRLAWADDKSGAAALPMRVPGRTRNHAGAVTHTGDRVTVNLPAA